MSTTPSQVLADQLVFNISPANNVYSYNAPVVTWAGVNGATTYSNSSDCSSFVVTLLNQAYGYTAAQYTKWTGYSVPQAEYLYDAAVADKGFTGFTQIADVQVGDVMFMKYLTSSTDTGHCVTIDALPVLVSTTATQRAYNVTVVDCTGDPHTADTRSGTESGVGRGTMRMYTDLKGNFVSYSWGTSKASVIETSATDPAIFAKLPPVTGNTWLAAGSSATWNSSSHALVVSGPAAIVADPGSDSPIITQSGTATQLLVMPGATSVVHMGSLTLTNGAVATVYDPNSGSVLLDVNSGSSTISIDPTSQLDLMGNDMKVQTGSLPAITALIARGIKTGSGIVSSTANSDTTHLTTLGVMLNSTGSSAIYTSFDGTVSVSTDVLVRYTYYGDANLDGKIDGSDYSRLDNGYLNHTTLTGWSNGDFNYDGSIDGSDYTLIDNAFNTQESQVVFSPSSQIAYVIKPAALISVPLPTPSVFSSTAIGDDWFKKTLSAAGAGSINLLETVAA